MQKNLHHRSISFAFVQKLLGLALAIVLAACTQKSAEVSGNVPTNQPVIATLTPSSTFLPSQTFTPTITSTCVPTSTPRWADVPWAAAMKTSAESFIRNTPADTLKLVQSFNYVNEAPGVPPQESADNTCGPLGVSIFSKAGIFYPKKTPVVLHDWWEPDPTQGMPWAMFDMTHYQLYQFLTYTADGLIGDRVTHQNIPGDPNHAVQNFDFTSFPLCPGDWVYTRSIGNGFDHLWAVSEVDAQNRVWAVGNVPEATSDLFIIQRILLYDPSDMTVGGFKHNFINHHAGTSGKAGFWLLRLKGGCITPPGYDQFLVNP